MCCVYLFIRLSSNNAIFPWYITGNGFSIPLQLYASQAPAAPKRQNLKMSRERSRRFLISRSRAHFPPPTSLPACLSSSCAHTVHLLHIILSVYGFCLTLYGGGELRRLLFPAIAIASRCDGHTSAIDRIPFLSKYPRASEKEIKINQFIVVTFDEKNKIKQKMFKIENGRDLRRKLLQ